jgi:hypothetical protein
VSNGVWDHFEQSVSSNILEVINVGLDFNALRSVNGFGVLFMKGKAGTLASPNWICLKLLVAPDGIIPG